MAKESRIGGFVVKHSPSVSRSQVERAVSTLASEKRLTHSASCPIIVFSKTKRKGGRAQTPVAVQRCEGRSLPKKGSAKAKARWNKIRGKKVCRAKGTGAFKRCR